MIKSLTLKVLGAAALGALIATSATAADKGDTNKSGMYESGDRGVKTPSSGGNDATQRAPKAGSGVATMPGKNNPSSVSESAPQKTGKETAAPKMHDGPKMANPKVPSSVSESAPQKTGKEQGGTAPTR